MHWSKPFGIISRWGPLLVTVQRSTLGYIRRNESVYMEEIGMVANARDEPSIWMCISESELHADISHVCPKFQHRSTLVCQRQVISCNRNQPELLSLTHFDPGKTLQCWHVATMVYVHNILMFLYSLVTSISPWLLLPHLGTNLADVQESGRSLEEAGSDLAVQKGVFEDNWIMIWKG